MSETKTILHRFDCSAFDEELGFLDAMSEKGWQLADMRVFTQKYIRDDSAVYRYAIDFQESLSAYDFSRYRAEFEDQGWTFAANRGNWYVFRRPYDPALPEEAYLLYTDEPSFRDMKTRADLAVNIAALFYLPSILRYISLSSLILTAACVFWLVDGIARQRRFRRIRRVPKPYRFHLWRYSILPLLLLVVLSFVFLPFGTDLYMSDSAIGVQQEQFTLRSPDFFALELRIYGPHNAEDTIPHPVFTITDESGRTADSGLMDPNGKPTNEFLRAGTYTLTVDWDAAFAPGTQRADDGTIYSVNLTSGSLLWNMDTTAFYIAWLVWLFVSSAVCIAADRLAKRASCRTRREE